MSFEVMDPTAEREIVALKAAPPLLELRGRSVGLLDNGKYNVQTFCDHVESILREDYGVAHVVRAQKFNASAPADDQVLEQLSRCDAVISAVGD